MNFDHYDQNIEQKRGRFDWDEYLRKKKRKEIDDLKNKQTII